MAKRHEMFISQRFTVVELAKAIIEDKARSSWETLPSLRRLFSTLSETDWEFLAHLVYPEVVTKAKIRNKPRSDEAVLSAIKSVRSGSAQDSAIDYVLTCIGSGASARPAISKPIIVPVVPELLLAPFMVTPWPPKLIMVGISPYNAPESALGVAFSSPDPTPTTMEICKNVNDFYIGKSRAGARKCRVHDMCALARQGVLFLNASMAVSVNWGGDDRTKENTAANEKIDWRPVTRTIIMAIARKCAENGHRIVIALFGEAAQATIPVSRGPETLGGMHVDATDDTDPTTTTRTSRTDGEEEEEEGDDVADDDDEDEYKDGDDDDDDDGDDDARRYSDAILREAKAVHGMGRMDLTASGDEDEQIRAMGHRVIRTHYPTERKGLGWRCIPVALNIDLALAECGHEKLDWWEDEEPQSQ